MEVRRIPPCVIAHDLAEHLVRVGPVKRLDLGPGKMACYFSSKPERRVRSPGCVAATPQQDAPDFLRRLGAQLGVAFDAIESGVGRQQNVGMLAQPFVCERLGFDDVETGA